MWANNSTVNCKMKVPSMTATTPAKMIVDCANMTGSQIETGSQIAAGFEEEEWYQAR